MKIKITKNSKSFYVNPCGPKRSLFRFLRAILDRDNFWKGVKNNTWEVETFRIFDFFLNQRCSFIDMGAWIGPTVLYGIQLASHCYAVEPDPVAFSILKENVHLNPELKNRITLCNIAISDSNGKVTLAASEGLGKSDSSMYKSYSSGYPVEVDCLSFPAFCQRYNVTGVNFVNIDTEGAEIVILPSMVNFIKDYKPTVYLSLHPQLFPDQERNIIEIIEVMELFTRIYDNKLNRLSLSYIEATLASRKGMEVVLSFQ